MALLMTFSLFRGQKKCFVLFYTSGAFTVSHQYKLPLHVSFFILMFCQVLKQETSLFIVILQRFICAFNDFSLLIKRARHLLHDEIE